MSQSEDEFPEFPPLPDMLRYIIQTFREEARRVMRQMAPEEEHDAGDYHLNEESDDDVVVPVLRNVAMRCGTDPALWHAFMLGLQLPQHLIEQVFDEVFGEFDDYGGFSRSKKGMGEVDGEQAIESLSKVLRLHNFCGFIAGVADHYINYLEAEETPHIGAVGPLDGELGDFMAGMKLKIITRNPNP